MNPQGVLVRLVRSIDTSPKPRSTPKSYRRAATQRFGAALYLLGDPDLALDSVYLGGYAAECSLKALVLGRTPASKRAAVAQDIESGAKAHNFDFLASLVRLRIGDIPADVEAAIVAISRRWRTDLRYAGSRVPREEAVEFLEQVRTILRWAERS